MRRLIPAVMCGVLALASGHRALRAAPATEGGAPPAAAPGAEPKATDVDKRTPPRRPAVFQLAEPSAAVKRRAKKLRTAGKVLMYTGIGLSGGGLAATIAGAVLMGIQKGEGAQTIGIICLAVGVAALVTGTALWAVGQSRMNKADVIILRAKVRQAQVVEPPQTGTPTRAAGLPPTRTVLSYQFRF